MGISSAYGWAALAALLIGFVGCSPVERETRWTCIIDIAGDSQCKVVSCDELQSLCTAKHRILKNYVARRAIAYTPTTDYKKCMKTVAGN